MYSQWVSLVPWSGCSTLQVTTESTMEGTATALTRTMEDFSSSGIGSLVVDQTNVLIFLHLREGEK